MAETLTVEEYLDAATQIIEACGGDRDKAAEALRELSRLISPDQDGDGKGGAVHTKGRP